MQSALDRPDPENARVAASPNEPPDPPEILATKGGIVDFPCEPRQETEGLAENEAPGLDPVPGMSPPVPAGPAAEVQPSAQIKGLEPIEIRGGVVERREDVDEPVAEPFAAEAQRDDIGAKLWLRRGVEPPLLDHP